MTAHFTILEDDLTGPAFEPALAMYRAHGFTEGGAFADYLPNPFSRFFHLTL